MIGTTIGQYKITAKLGAGGMGEVFLAEDTKLQRKVALKFLPEKLSSDPDFKSRFEHEARAAAALEHPNIITVYELGEHEGRMFIAMQRVNGSTLAELIDSEALSMRKTLDLALQILDGLSAAHAEGIVHRDIKPANILVDESGRAHILDFGLAKSRKATTETKVGSTLGTVQYESPEQSRGEIVDHRSDLFSFGVVLYEMITGKLPFIGDYDEAIRYAISHETAEPLARYKSNVPEGLEQVVTKTLEKETDLRYQTASGAIADLKRIQRDLTQTTPAVSRITPATGIAAPEPVRKSSKRIIFPVSVITVLIAAALILKPWKIEVSPTQEAQAMEDRLAIMYFDNIADPSDSLRQGEIVANLLITDISASTQLKVVSSQRLYDILKLLGREGEKRIDRGVASQIAEKARAKWMLTGNILRTEPNVVLTAQLVEVATGNVLTSTRIDGAEGEDIFSMVDKLTAGITQDLSAPAAAISETPNVADLTTISAEAYRYYLEGRDLKNRYKRFEAREAFEKSIELDSNFAMSYYWLSRETGNRETIAKAMELRDRVGEMDRLTIESRSAFLNRDYENAFNVLDQLIEKYPDEKLPYHRKATLYRIGQFRKYKESVALLEKIIEIDPLDKNAYNSLAYDYEKIDQFDKSLWAINKYIELAPDEPNPYDSRAELFAFAGRLEEAGESYAQALDKDPDFLAALNGAAEIKLWQGDVAEAERMYQKNAGHSNKNMRRNSRWHRVRVALYQGRLREAQKRTELALQTDAVELGDGTISTSARVGTSLLETVGRLTGRTELFDSAYTMVEKYHTELLADTALDTLAVKIGVKGNLQRLATLAALRGEFNQAYKYLNEFSKATDTTVYWDRLFLSITKHSAELSQGNYEEALKKVEWMITEENAKVFPTLYYVGMTYLSVGRVAEAVETLERASTRYDSFRHLFATESVLVHFELGKAYEASGWNDKAIQKYEEFLHIWRNADEDILLLKEARDRLAKLKA